MTMTHVRIGNGSDDDEFPARQDLRCDIAEGGTGRRTTEDFM
jgi:hypothetical protein